MKKDEGFIPLDSGHKVWFQRMGESDATPLLVLHGGPGSGHVYLAPLGNLKDWDRTGRVSEVRIPTLIVVGRYDELTPACAETLHAGISGSELVVFEESSQIPHPEEEDRYMAVVSEFLDRA